MRFQDLTVKGLGTGWLGAGVLGLVLGTCGIVMAQEPKEDSKPQQEEPKKQDEARPSNKQEEPREAKPSGEQEPARAEEGKPAKNEKQDERQNGEMKSAPENNRPVQNNERGMQNTQNNHDEHMAQGSSGHGQRIPDDKFRANFGHEHHFRVQTTVVEGQPRFQYGGYWFALSNPWPGDWAYTDDCYVDYIDGEYVLLDLMHPGVQIVLVVVG